MWDGRLCLIHPQKSKCSNYKYNMLCICFGVFFLIQTSGPASCSSFYAGQGQIFQNETTFCTTNLKWSQKYSIKTMSVMFEKLENVTTIKTVWCNNCQCQRTWDKKSDSESDSDLPNSWIWFWMNFVGHDVCKTKSMNRIFFNSKNSIF